LEDVVKEITAEGGEATGTVCDVTAPEAVSRGPRITATAQLHRASMPRLSQVFSW
jgi:hypothetical protein